MGISDDIAAQILAGQGATPVHQPLSVSDQIASQIQSEAPQPAAEAGPGFFSRVGERLSGRAETFQEITAEPPDSTLESLSKGVQVLGNVVAGGLVDVAGETISTGFDLLSQATRAITPDFIEDPIVSKVGDAFESLAGTEVAQAGIEAARQGIGAYQAWAEENPEGAKIASSLGNIALVAAPIKGKPALRPGPPAPTVVGRAAKAATEAGTAQVAARRAAFLDTLVKPRATKAVREAEIIRTAEGGLAASRTVTPSVGEAAIAKSLDGIQGVNPGKTLLQNLKAIQAEIGVESKSLMAKLEAMPVQISRPGMKRRLLAVTDRLSQNPILVGDAAKTAERTVAKAQQLLKANANTPAGVLKARQQFDEWVGKQRPKIFDPSTESALSIAVRETRQEMNAIINERLPSAGVRQSLTRQSNMFRAIDNIAPKAAEEASTAVGRFAQMVKGSLGLDKGFSNLLPTIAGAAAISGATAVAPATVAGGVALLGAGAGAKRMITSPAVKKAIGNLLRQSERAIQKAKSEGNKELVKQLRAGRASVIEVFRNLDVGDPTPPKQEGEAPDNSGGVLVPFNPDIHTPKDVGLGGPSTEFLITEEAPDGGFWNIPSIWWDSSGDPQILPAEEAQARALAFEELTGKLFPRFDSPEAGSESAKQRSQSGGASKSMLATLPKRGN